jgi:hypothetical protein
MLGVGCRADDLLCRKIIVANSKEVKTRNLLPRNRQVWQHLLKEVMAQNGLFLLIIIIIIKQS